MLAAPYVKKKPGREVAYFQRRIPKDVRDLAPFDRLSNPFEKSLKTNKANVVHSRAAELNEWFEATVTAARAGLEPRPIPNWHHAESGSDRNLDPSVKTPSPEWISFAGMDHYDTIMSVTQSLQKSAGAAGNRGDARQRLDDWLEIDVAGLLSVEHELKDRNHRLVTRTAIRALASGGFLPIDSSIRLRGLKARHPVQDEAWFPDLCETLIDAELEAIAALKKLFESGIHSHEVRSKSLRSAPRSPTEIARYDIQKIGEQLCNASRNTNAHWLKRVQTAVELFVQLGGPSDVRAIGRAHVMDYIEHLRRCPKNKEQRYPELSWRKAILQNEKDGGPTFHPNTVRDNYFAAFRRVISYAVERGLIEHAPTAKVVVRGGSKKNRGTAFAIDELNTMLRLPQFVGCESASNARNAGAHLLDNHWYWGPLVALFTGARTSEIALLRIEEVKTDGKTPYIRIQERTGRTVKTAAATRSVPIHPILLELGFDEYLQRVAARGSDRLFPDWSAATPNQAANEASQRHFRRNVVPKVSIRVSPRPNFHSFRHTMKSQMTRSAIREQHQNAILGHEQSDMDGVYLGTIDLDTLTHSMRQVSFEGLEYSHLVGTRK